MSKIIVVIGVTGIQGSSVADTFLRIPGWKVRGISRNPSSQAAQDLTAAGVEVLKGDLDDKQSLLPAFDGASVIFANTDFFVHFWPGLGSSVDLGGRTLNKYASDREVEQGINIAEVAALPTVLKTLDHFVFSSLSDALKWSRGKYKNVYHNDSKTQVIQAVQGRFPELAARMSTVQLGHYVTNWKQAPQLAPQKQPDGSFLVTRPFPPEFRMPFVVAEKDTGAFVKALVALPPGKHLEGVSETMAWDEWTKLWGEIMGVKTSYKQVSYDEFFESMPEQLKVELIEAWQYVEEFGHTGGDPEVLTSKKAGINDPLTSMEEYIRSEDWSSIM